MLELHNVASDLVLTGSSICKAGLFSMIRIIVSIQVNKRTGNKNRLAAFHGIN